MQRWIGSSASKARPEEDGPRNGSRASRGELMSRVFIGRVSIQSTSFAIFDKKYYYVMHFYIIYMLY